VVVGTWVGTVEKSVENLEDSVRLYTSEKGLTEAQCTRVDEAVGKMPVQLLRPDLWPKECRNDGVVKTPVKQ
jgi:hypothetical protein